ncbi:hypothetical protein TRICI_004550 [Trichomonascus ciferrii]|uniref:Translation initiation factor eIF2 assembly protein n=1 Tax=Trichomonascus ciferrii TaxID=44093 RepID=A0A642UZY1_9ASCO|nr:hypothetical protein TRICI_004550 [Trichomonascus ciferrii]
MPGATTSASGEGANGPSAPSVQHIVNCAYSSWHDKYKHLCPRSKVISDLPRAFIDYLLEDGIALPNDGYEWDNKSENGSDFGDQEDEVDDPTHRFPELHQKILDTIQSLGGSVTPKLNWSAPRDATWISTTNNLKCVTAADIYILLKASSYITHDLTQAFDDCDPDEPRPSEQTFDLVLRKWVDVNPAMEFRCFVKDRELVGVTQRDMNYYEFLNDLKPKLLTLIQSFFRQNLQTSFPDSSFVFDVYIPRPFDRVWLVDINPYAFKTDTKLYDWSQIVNIDPFDDNFIPEIRLVDKSDSSRGFGTVEHSENAVPKDIVDASMSGQGIVDLVKQWRLAQEQQDEESSDDD